MRPEDEDREFAELREAVQRLPRGIEPPRDLWPGIEARIRRRPIVRWAWLAAAAALAAVLLGRWVVRNEAWRVVPLAGSPAVGDRRLTDAGLVRVGQWIETDARSRAHLEVGEIGELQVEPRSRLRLLAARPADHRLALAHGTILARVSAPPRLFVVETPSAVAVDLGCAYRLEVDSAGNGLLQVTGGLVELGSGRRISIVPFGAHAPLRAGYGPGVPYAADASPELRGALAALEFEQAGPAALATVLASARRDDGLSLWHLLARVDSAERAQIYDRLAALVPPPTGVTRAGVLRLDRDMLDLYWNYIPGTVWRPEWRVGQLGQ